MSGSLRDRLRSWCETYGKALCPTAGYADTYGEGIRSAHNQVANIMAACVAPSKPAQKDWGHEDCDVCDEARTAQDKSAEAHVREILLLLDQDSEVSANRTAGDLVGAANYLGALLHSATAKENAMVDALKGLMRRHHEDPPEYDTREEEAARKIIAASKGERDE